MFASHTSFAVWGNWLLHMGILVGANMVWCVIYWGDFPLFEHWKSEPEQWAWRGLLVLDPQGHRRGVVQQHRH